MRGKPYEWGAINSKKSVARGITFASCVGHGGYYVSPTLNARIHPKWRNANGWYEEDCEWAIVALTFFQHFSESNVKQAHQTAKDYFPDGYEAVFGVKLTGADSHERRREEFEAANADRYKTNCAWNAGSTYRDRRMPVPDGMVGVSAGTGPSRRDNERWFLVPADEYRQRGQFGFVIDETRHAEWPQNGTTVPAPVTRRITATETAELFGTSKTAQAPASADIITEGNTTVTETAETTTAAAETTELVLLPHSGISAPHNGFVFASVEAGATGDFFQTDVLLNGKLVGAAAGPDTEGDAFFTFSTADPSIQFGRYHLDEYLRACRDDRGRPVTESGLLYGLYEEHCNNEVIVRYAELGKRTFRSQAPIPGLDGEFYTKRHAGLPECRCPKGMKLCREYPGYHEPVAATDGEHRCEPALVLDSRSGSGNVAVTCDHIHVIESVPLADFEGSDYENAIHTYQTERIEALDVVPDADELELAMYAGWLAGEYPMDEGEFWQLWTGEAWVRLPEAAASADPAAKLAEAEPAPAPAVDDVDEVEDDEDDDDDDEDDDDDDEDEDDEDDYEDDEDDEDDEDEDDK